jgi:hypothetical protein
MNVPIRGAGNVRTNVLTSVIWIDILSLSRPAMRFEWETRTRTNKTFVSITFGLKLPFSFSTIRTLLRNAIPPLTMRNAG